MHVISFIPLHLSCGVDASNACRHRVNGLYQLGESSPVLP